MGAVCFGYMMDITTLIASLLTYHYRHKCSGSTFRVAGAAASVAVLTILLWPLETG